MKKIIKLLPRLALILALFPLIGVNLAVAYIMFAPDSWPKPFYLMYAPPPLPAPGEEAGTGEEPTNSDGEPGTAHAAGSEGEAGEVLPGEIHPGQGLMVDTGSKIVNLVDPTGRKYLRVGIVLEFAPGDLNYYTMPPEEKTVFLEEFNTEMSTILPVISDIIITALSTQTFESVYTAEGKENLRKSIMETVNKQVPEKQVIFVYFTEFVVQ